MAETSQDPAPLFRAAIQALAKGDPAAARLLPALDAFPDFAPGWLALASVLRDRGQSQAAALTLLRAVRAASATPAMLHQGGQAFAQLGQRDAAMSAFRRAVAQDPGFAPAWYSLGLALQDCAACAEAAAAFERAFALKPDFHEAAFNAGVAWQGAGEMAPAMDAYAASYRLRPDSFGRIAQALIAAPTGALWLRPSALRAVLDSRAAA
ncbi:tetratricopeptide repeat protein [Acidisoma cellulosilytica]|uniref:Tetratricopeptide repeat protein n=1 Tax=Acidisoma cellulosilyticum TaxID=2802395 RepID=A0A963Z6S3_9PROT|nr:tetratricopeptide repeat protein [Acidisoma cellulosilyticum]MCB8883611.1 tetratricopeptide repeat protein [Acidisoma cellulosilyticum]